MVRATVEVEVLETDSGARIGQQDGTGEQGEIPRKELEPNLLVELYPLMSTT